jgi:hypothetical protein
VCVVIHVARNGRVADDVAKALAVLADGASATFTGDARRLRQIRDGVTAAGTGAVAFLGDDDDGRPVLHLDGDGEDEGALYVERAPRPVIRPRG